MVKKKGYGLWLGYCSVVFLIMGSLGAHPGPLTSFNEMVQLLKPVRSRVGKVTDKRCLHVYLRVRRLWCSMLDLLLVSMQKNCFMCVALFQQRFLISVFFRLLI